MMFKQWKTTENGIIAVFTVDDADVEVPIGLDMVKQLIMAMPPTEESRIRELLEKIYEIRKNRLLTIEQLDKDAEVIRDAYREVRTKSLEGDEKMNKTTANIILSTNKGEKTILDVRRHLVKYYYQEEGKLRGELARLMTGTAKRVS